MGKVKVKVIRELDGYCIVKCSYCDATGKYGCDPCPVCNGNGKVKLKGEPSVFKYSGPTP